MSAGHLIVIVAPSGTGKSTLINRIKSEYPKIEWSVSCTTRPIRAGEVDGVNYHYLSEEEFKKRISSNDFIEWAQVHSNYYGTSKSFTQAGLDSGRKMLFDLDIQGADAIKQLYPKDSSAIFIEPPSIEVLEERLTGRGTEKPEVIAERLANAKKELLKKNDYDYLVMNDELEKAYSELKAIIGQILEQ